MKKITLSVAALSIAVMSYSQTQCKGMTKNNIQCKNIIKNSKSLCHLHDPNYTKKVEGNTVICSGTTKSGNKCKNRTKDLSKMCHLHRKNK